MVTGFEKSIFMIKKCSYFSGIVLLIAVLASGFKSYEIAWMDHTKKVMELEAPLYYYVATEEEMLGELAQADFADATPIPFTGKSFTGFKQALAVRESLGLYTLVNSYGYMGKYQFGKSALRAVGIHNTSDFLNNPVKQEKAFNALLSKNKWELRSEIKKFVGKSVGGVPITESGLLAAAHLGGAGSVRKYLKTNGQAAFRDGFGTSIQTYLKKFAGYDTSHIEANSSPIVAM